MLICPGYNIEFAAANVDGFYPPVSLGDGSINAPLNPPSYMGYQWFPFSQSQGFSAQTCADYCDAQTRYNVAHYSPDCSYVPCTFVNAYVLSKNGVPQGLYCAIYNATWDKSYATNHVRYDQQGNNYTVSQSYGYRSNAAFPPQPVYAPYCGSPYIKDGDFDSQDLNTYPYLKPYWNYSTVGSATANGGWSPGYEGSRFMFGAGLYGSNPAPSVTLSQVLTIPAPRPYAFYFQYKFDQGMDVCQIYINFPNPTHAANIYYGSPLVKLAGQTPNTWYEYFSNMDGGPGQTLGFVFSCPNATAPGGQIFIDSVGMYADFSY